MFGAKKSGVFGNTLLLIIAFVPIFLRPNGSLYTGNSLEPEFAAPLWFFILPFFIFARVQSLLNNAYVFVTLLVFFCFGAVIFFTHGSFNLLLLYFIPVIVFQFLFYDNRNSQLNISVYFRVYFIFAALHVISSILEHGILGSFIARGSDGVFNIFTIHQKEIYFSTNLGMAVLLSKIEKNILVRYLGLLFIFIDILILASREALILAVLGLLISLPPRVLLFFFVSLVILVSQIDFTSFTEEFKIVEKLGTISESKDVTGGRSDMISENFQTNIEAFNLFTGNSFNDKINDGRTPHNMYLEMYLRGGLLLVIFYVVILYNLIKKIDFSLRNLFFVALVIILSFNINTPMRAPLFALPFLILLNSLQPEIVSKETREN
jgi:hypothetical protein